MYSNHEIKPSSEQSVIMMAPVLLTEWQISGCMLFVTFEDQQAGSMQSHVSIAKGSRRLKMHFWQQYHNQVHSLPYQTVGLTK